MYCHSSAMFGCRLKLACTNSTTVCGKYKFHFSIVSGFFFIFLRAAPINTAFESVHLSSCMNIAVTLWYKNISENRSYLSSPNKYSFITPCSVSFSNRCLTCFPFVFNCPLYSFSSVWVFHRSTPPCPSAVLHWVQTRKRFRISPSTA